jgi:hypothetical protein
MQWLRLYHDTPNDPKWRKVAVRSGQPVGNVLAVWTMMLVNASEAIERGNLEDWDDETVAAVLGYSPDTVTAIRIGMQGVVLAGNALTGWSKRQKSSDNTAERMRRMRAKNAHDDGGNGGSGGDPKQKANGADSRHGDDTVTSHSGPVTSQTADVTSPPSRALDLQIQESNSVASATGAEAPEPPTILDVIYGECRKWLIESSGKPDGTVRKRIGDWRKAWSDGTILDAITIAQTKARTDHLSDPLTYIAGILKNRAKKNGQQSDGTKHDRLADGLAGAFVDQLDPRPASSSEDGRAVAVRYH